MSDVCLICDLGALLECEAFFEATREELRVVLAVAAHNGTPTSYESIAEESGVSVARAKSAIALFSEVGVLKSVDSFAELVDEFDLKEKSIGALSSAASLRDEDLKGLIDEISIILERPDGLSGEEVKLISSLTMEKALSAEYIAGLVAYMAGDLAKKGKKLTVRALVSKAEQLKEKNIDTLEELEIYIMKKETETGEEWEFRRVIGLFGRSPSDSEREAFHRWSGEYGYSVNIVKEAHSIACANIAVNSNPVPYMDKVITAWHSAGYTTLEECIADHNSGKHNFKSELDGKKSSVKKSREAEKPKFSDFDSEDALQRALLRSYGTTEDN